MTNIKKIAMSLESKIINSKFNENYFTKPFKHIVIDNFLPLKLAKTARESFPSKNHSSWEKSSNPGIEVKQRSNWQSEFDIPDGLIDLIRVLNSSILLKAIGSKLDIPKLMPDPYFTGGGLNVSYLGGHLDVHVDGNYHDASGMNRRVNILIYLNKGWKESYGGHFGIYDNKGIKLVKSIEPTHNRCVIFDTHDKSFHGLPNPINFPNSNPRKSILLYYYTVAKRPSKTILVEKPHSALWRSKGWNDKKGKKTRKFK